MTRPLLTISTKYTTYYKTLLSLAAKILDEKKVKENENAMLRAKVAKMNELLSSYDSKHTRQSDEVQQSQMELHELREDRKSQRKEVKDLNETVASLNRDKVNLLREMSLIHDEKENFETEVLTIHSLPDQSNHAPRTRSTNNWSTRCRTRS